MKLKYYWLQFLPLIGFIYVFLNKQYTWADYYNPEKKYFGKLWHFTLSAFIQTASILSILYPFIFKVMNS